ncbi:MAG: hypothetical protein LBC18_13680, partial [Opitutaceae bacterium]|nr:hypothetical protein [Opitutaceae bacterium]
AAFAAAPNVTASLVAPSGDAPVIAFVLRAITATGFTVSLAAPAPASGYIITYTAISTAS